MLYVKKNLTPHTKYPQYTNICSQNVDTLSQPWASYFHVTTNGFHNISLDPVASAAIPHANVSPNLNLSDHEVVLAQVRDTSDLNVPSYLI